MNVLVIANLGLLLLGVAFLYAGGHALVSGAGGLALRLGLEPLVVGLTVVAFGTSAPELFVSLIAALRGSGGISLGNVIGSNVLNLALILGLVATIRPMTVAPQIRRADGPAMLVTYPVVALFLLNFGATSRWSGGTIERWEGALLLVGLTAYLAWLYRRSRANAEVAESMTSDVPEAAPRSLLTLIGLIAAGVLGLAFGSEALVRGASWLAIEVLGASERFVGLAIVALGTSLPELVTSVVAVSKGSTDLLVGNLVGSNIFNGLSVLGLAALVRPIEVGATSFGGDFAFMAATSVLVLIGIQFNHRAGRLLGIVLLLSYAAYVGYLVATFNT